MTTNPKPSVAFTVFKNYRAKQEKKKVRKGSLHVGTLKGAQRIRKLTEQYDPNIRIEGDPEQLETYDILQEHSVDWKKIQGDLQQCIPVNLTEIELDAQSPFLMAQPNYQQSFANKNYTTAMEEEPFHDDLTL